VFEEAREQLALLQFQQWARKSKRSGLRTCRMRSHRVTPCSSPPGRADVMSWTGRSRGPPGAKPSTPASYAVNCRVRSEGPWAISKDPISEVLVAEAGGVGDDGAKHSRLLPRHREGPTRDSRELQVYRPNLGEFAATGEQFK